MFQNLVLGPQNLTTYQALLKIRLQSQKQGRSLCVPALNLEAFALPSCDLENWGWFSPGKFGRGILPFLCVCRLPTSQHFSRTVLV